MLGINEKRSARWFRKLVSTPVVAAKLYGSMVISKRRRGGRSAGDAAGGRSIAVTRASMAVAVTWVVTVAPPVVAVGSAVDILPFIVSCLTANHTFNCGHHSGAPGAAAASLTDAWTGMSGQLKYSARNSANPQWLVWL